MRQRTRLLIVIAVLLLVTSAAQAQSPINDQTPAPILSGGAYRLITNGPPAASNLTGARYQLSPAAPTAGEGCCCKTNLPCITR